MKAELFREINCRFLLSELGDSTCLFHSFKENTTVHDISKLEESFIIQFSNIPTDSVLQSVLKEFHWKRANAQFACYFITFI